MEPDRRKEERNAPALAADVYLSRRSGGPPVTPVFSVQLISLSLRGAGVALHEIMSGRTHLAFEPMESETIRINLRLNLDNEEEIVRSAKPVWFNKMVHTTTPPFRIGLEFIQPLSPGELNRINRHLR